MAADGRPMEAIEGWLLQKLASDSRPGTGVEMYCHGSAAFVGVGGGGRRSEANDSVARRRPAALIVAIGWGMFVSLSSFGFLFVQIFPAYYLQRT